MVRPAVLRWHVRGAAPQRCVSIYHSIPLIRAKKLVSVEDAPSAPLRGEDIYYRMLMASGLMKNSFDGASNEKSSH